MKGKNVFFALGLSLVMGLGAVAALGANRRVQKAEAWASSYWSHVYIVGGFTESDGSFLEMTSTDGGDYERVVELTAGDWFKFTNQANWDGITVARNWGQITSQACWTTYTTDGGGDNHNFIINDTGKYRVYMEKAAVEGSWDEAEYGIHIEEYVEKQDPSAETNDFLILDEYKVLGDNLNNIHIYGFGQDANIKSMDWPGTGTVEEHDTDILPTYQGHISTSYPKIIINNGTSQTVDIEDFESNYSSKVLCILNTKDEHNHYNYQWKTLASIDRPAQEGYYISSAGLWDYAHAVQMTTTDQGGNVAYKMNLSLNSGAIIRVRSFWTDRAPFDLWANSSNTDGEHWTVENNNVTITATGSYDIYAYYESEQLKYSVADHVDNYEITMTAVLFDGKTPTGTDGLSTQIAYSTADFEPNKPARSGYVAREVYYDEECETPYTPKKFDATDHLYIKYTRTGYYVVGDETFSGAGLQWSVDGGSYLTTDVQDKTNNMLEGAITISGASVGNPVQVRPAEYTSEGNLDYSLSYTMGGTYEFATKVGNNINFTQDGTYAIYVNKSAQVYINAGADAFYTKFLTEVSAICNADGNTNVTNLKSVWSAQEVAYNSLSTEEKNAIKAVGFDDVGEEDDLHKVVTKYHYIVVKYYSQGVNDFIWNAYSGSNIVRFANNSVSNTAIITIVAVSAFATATLVGLFFIIRRKRSVK